MLSITMQNTNNNEKTVLPVEGLVKQKTILEFLDVSDSKWRSAVTSGKVKQPVRLGRSIRWDVDYIRELKKTGF